MMKRYLVRAIFDRVGIPGLGRIRLNVAALAVFAVMGLDHPAFWIAGIVWETIWLACTAGRSAWRRMVDNECRRAAATLHEENRLNLYGRLSPASKARHFELARQVPRLAGDTTAADLFLAIHLRLLAAVDGFLIPERDYSLPFLDAGALLDLTDPDDRLLAKEALAAAASPDRLSGTEARRTAFEAFLIRIERRLHPSFDGNLQEIPCAATLNGKDPSCDGVPILPQHVIPSP